MAKAPDGFYILTDTQITIQGLKDPTGVYITDATVTAALKTRGGQAVAGCESLTFDFVPNSNGDYVGTVPATAAIKEGTEYDLVVTFTRQARRMTVVVRRTAAFLFA